MPRSFFFPLPAGGGSLIRSHDVPSSHFFVVVVFSLCTRLFHTGTKHPVFFVYLEATPWAGGPSCPITVSVLICLLLASSSLLQLNALIAFCLVIIANLVFFIIEPILGC
ncbi:hypothetical protein BC940DRAFT_307165 [Gongronella butleri]|nr:hypothetical protein BC940DRAFT_307165 [Gongronella butleri]